MEVVEEFRDPSGAPVWVLRDGGRYFIYLPSEEEAALGRPLRAPRAQELGPYGDLREALTGLSELFSP